MSEYGDSESFRMSAGVQERLKEKERLSQKMDSFNDKLYKAGLNVFKWGVAYPSGFISEYLMPPGTSWLTRMIPVVIGLGLDKLGKLNPGHEKGGLTRLIRTLGQGLWRGGAFGMASMMVVNTAFDSKIPGMAANKALMLAGGSGVKPDLPNMLPRIDAAMSDGLNKLGNIVGIP
jgi:hypothetical protein